MLVRANCVVTYIVAVYLYSFIVCFDQSDDLLIVVAVIFITAARPAYAGTEGCSILLVFFISFLFNESP